LRTAALGANEPPAPPSSQANWPPNWLLASASGTGSPWQDCFEAPASRSGQQIVVTSTTSLPASAEQAAAVALSVHSGTSSKGSAVIVSVASGHESVMGWT
jgi:hypothetical protein